MAVVLAVGTRFIGQASSDTPQSRATSAVWASVDSQSLQRFEDAHELVGLAAVRQRDDDIVPADDAEVAVNRFGRMQEDGRGTRAREGRGNLPADDAGLAHACEDDAALAVAEEMDGTDESLIEPIDQREDRRGLGVQDFAGQ
jgi:hypothetical protein